MQRIRAMAAIIMGRVLQLIVCRIQRADSLTDAMMRLRLGRWSGCWKSECQNECEDCNHSKQITPSYRISSLSDRVLVDALELASHAHVYHRNGGAGKRPDFTMFPN